METCPTCNLQSKWNNKCNQELTNTHLAANFCQQCKRIINLGGDRSHLQSNEHENNKKLFYCEVCRNY